MRKNELDLQIEQLYDLGRRTFDDLRDAEIDVLTALLLQTSEHRWDYIGESEEETLPGKLAEYLLERSEDNKIEAITALANGARMAAKTEINKLFEKRAEIKAFHNPSREMSETEIMVINHNRAVAAEINQLNGSQLC